MTLQIDVMRCYGSSTQFLVFVIPHVGTATRVTSAKCKRSRTTLLLSHTILFDARTIACGRCNCSPPRKGETLKAALVRWVEIEVNIEPFRFRAGSVVCRYSVTVYPSSLLCHPRTGLLHLHSGCITAADHCLSIDYAIYTYNAYGRMI